MGRLLLWTINGKKTNSRDTRSRSRLASWRFSVSRSMRCRSAPSFPATARRPRTGRETHRTARASAGSQRGAANDLPFHRVLDSSAAARKRAADHAAPRLTKSADAHLAARQDSGTRFATRYAARRIRHSAFAHSNPIRIRIDSKCLRKTFCTKKSNHSLKLLHSRCHPHRATPIFTVKWPKTLTNI